MVLAMISSAWKPAAACSVGWKSREMRFRITSATSGWEERMKDSVQQVHESPSIQSTGMRGFDSSAWTTFGTKVASSPIVAVMVVQNLRKVRRSSPCSRSTSQVDGPCSLVSDSIPDLRTLAIREL
jgi:hypothetical protein